MCEKRARLELKEPLTSTSEVSDGHRVAMSICHRHRLHIQGCNTRPGPAGLHIWPVESRRKREFITFYHILSYFPRGFHHVLDPGLVGQAALTVDHLVVLHEAVPVVVQGSHGDPNVAVEDAAAHPLAAPHHLAAMMSIYSTH